MGRKKTTGRYETREKLVEEVMQWIKVNNSFALTSVVVGVSEATVAKIYKAKISGVALP